MSHDFVNNARPVRTGERDTAAGQKRSERGRVRERKRKEKKKRERTPTRAANASLLEAARRETLDQRSMYVHLLGVRTYVRTFVRCGDSDACTEEEGRGSRLKKKRQGGEEKREKQRNQGGDRER